jgi:hypothetical protein
LNRLNAGFEKEDVMPELDELALPAAKQLLQSDEDQLYEELGIRQKAILRDPGLAGSFSPEASYNAVLMGPMDDLRNFGKLFFSRLNRDCYDLICGGQQADAKEREKVAKAFGLGKTEVAAAIAGVIVAHFAIAPAIAAVVAALVVKLFFRNAQEAMCQVWKQKLPQS